MSGDSYKFQMSFKFGPGGIGMMNIRADTSEEFNDKVNEALASLGPSAILVEAYNTEFAGVSVPGPANAGSSTGASQQASSGEVCMHGSMVFRTGTGANGPWSGWFCPTEKNDPNKCKPKFMPKAR